MGKLLHKLDLLKVYRLSLSEEDNHSVVKAACFTKLWGITLAIAALIVLVCLLYVLLVFTPLHATIPGYPDANFRRKAVAGAIKIDSLERAVLRWELYSENLSRVLAGDRTVSIDSLLNVSAVRTPGHPDAEAIAGSDARLREAVHQEEEFNLASDGSERTLPLEGKHFFTPLRGVVSQGYDLAIHPAVDITAPANSVVKAVMDGAVISTGWSDETGYVIMIQHSGDLVSIYKHNQRLLHKAGDRVKAGEPIAHVGNTGSLTTGDHLHFELWHSGTAVDPTKYISF